MRMYSGNRLKSPTNSSRSLPLMCWMVPTGLQPCEQRRIMAERGALHPEVGALKRLPAATATNETLKW